MGLELIEYSDDVVILEVKKDEVVLFEKVIILIVEDDIDIWKFVGFIFSDIYEIIEVVNGCIGVEKVLK